MAGPLEGKTIVVGLGGGIACYKAAELVRLLITAGARVRVMMTPAATQFITPLTLQTLSGHPVATDLFNLTQESEIGHIRLADEAAAILIAPATADLIGRLAHGLANDIVSTVALATRAPIIVAPAMNVNMYENRIVQRNLEALRTHGMLVADPGEGFLACGWYGKGRIAEPTALVAELERAVSRQDLDGLAVLVTAGPNREAIDPVRFISNRSTGKMGFALAAAAWRRGARVELISGPTPLTTPYGVHRIETPTAADMHAAVTERLPSTDILLMAAAVADYRPARAAHQKLKKSDKPLSLELVRTIDILADLAPRKRPHQTFVGFAAETEEIEANARRKLREKGLDLIVANDVAGTQTGFEVDTNAVILFDRQGGRDDVPLMSKSQVADLILDRVVSLRGTN